LIPVRTAHISGRAPGFSPNSPGPIYDLDTKYFWRPESIRLRAENWENDSGHVTNPALYWLGHCGGMSNAQSMETDPPTDCGALSREDLEGLLAALDVRTKDYPQDPGPHITPGTLWWDLQKSMRDPPTQALVVDFYADTGNTETQKTWWWPVYKYEVDIDTQRGNQVFGVMKLTYEDHAKYADHAKDSASYGFWCLVDSNNNPIKGTGALSDSCSPPLDCPGPPDAAHRPWFADTTRDTTHHVNRYLNYNEIKRVIDHKTIIMDDAFMDYASPCQPPGASWVARPG
jgi:hypothetical protein